MMYPGLSRPAARKPVQPPATNFYDLTNPVFEPQRVVPPNPIDDLIPGPSLRVTSTPNPRAGPSHGPMLEQLYVSSTPRPAAPKTPAFKPAPVRVPVTPGTSRNTANIPQTPRMLMPRTPSASANIADPNAPSIPATTLPTPVPRAREPSNKLPPVSTSSDVSVLEAVAHQFTNSEINLPKVMAEATIFIGVLLLKWSSKATHPQRILNLLKIALVLGFVGLHPIYAAIAVGCLSLMYTYYKLAYLTKRLK